MNENYNLQPDTSEQIIRNGESYNLDTRERLEADLKTHMYEFGGYCFNSREGHADNVDTFFDGFIGLLNRQAAITEREVKERVNFSLITQTANALFPDYQERIAELTAERDQLSRDLAAEHALVIQFEHDNERLREAIDAMENGQFYSMYKAKCEECEEAVSFAKRLENAVNDGQPVTLFGVDYEKPNKKLLAEHERLTKKLKRLRRRLSKLRKERDYLQKVVKTQADSFKKLEIELGKQ